MGVSQHKGYLFGDPYHEDYSILGSILGSPCLGKPPYMLCLVLVLMIRFIFSLCPLNFQPVPI